MTYLQRIRKKLAWGAILAAPVLAALFVSQRPVQTDSVIVQGLDLASAMTAVQAVGGDITHELGIIRAVGASVTPRQLEALFDNKALAIYANGSVNTAAAVGTWAVRDEFSAKSYANNDGSVAFSGPWSEFCDDARVDGGDVRVDKDALVLKKPGRGIQRSVDLSGAASAMLSFDFGREEYN